MKIVRIFANHLLAFQYPEEGVDEFERLFDCWADVEFLESFFEDNKNDLTGNFWKTTVEMAVKKTLKEASLFEKKMLSFAENSEQGKSPDIKHLFRPLDNTSSGLVELSLCKSYGTDNPSWLRIYAIKLDEKCYIVTGGAIKLTKTMNEKPHLRQELHKMSRCKQWLKENGIIDNDGITL